LLVTANVVPSSPIFVALLMEAIRSSESPVLKKATRHHIPEDGILQSKATFWSTDSIMGSLALQ
jgi:hypothetical protein